MRFGGVTALDGVSLDVQAGEIVGVVGPNGAGKSTLFDCCTGVLKPTYGRILLAGADITGWRPYQVAKRGVARTFQIPHLSSGTCLDNVLVAATATDSSLAAVLVPRRPSKMARRLSLDALDACGAGHLADVSAAVLSPVQRRLVEIARVRVQRPSLVLMDEPTAGMDDEEAAAVGRIAVDLRNSGAAVIVVSHQLKALFSVADRVAVLHLGKLLFCGNPGQAGSAPEVARAYLRT
jgi:branched-chain amino acid transport system ATP-binding protein